MTPQMATLILYPNRFQILGPPELFLLTVEVVKRRTLDNDELKCEIEALWSNWYVICTISGEQIPLNLLKYWCVPTQQVYARPELVPNPY